MKKQSRVKTMLFALLIIFACFSLAATYAPGSAAAEVMWIGGADELEKLKSSYPNLIEIPLPQDKTGSDIVAVRPLFNPFWLGVYEVEYVNNLPERKNTLCEYDYQFGLLNENSVFLLRLNIPEGQPNLAIIVYSAENEYYSWYPQINGMDGSLVLDNGFEPWSK